MSVKQLKNQLLTLSILIPIFGWAQQNPGDCVGATVLCGDSAIDVIDDNGDVIDFNDPDNPLGCHLTGERSSTWLYFSFDDNMPPNQMLEFVISPYESDDEVDYDFSLYANVDCDSLGTPLRCSYSNGTLILNCGFCPDTGLGMGEIDTTEGPFGNGFLAPILVNPEMVSTCGSMSFLTPLSVLFPMVLISASAGRLLIISTVVSTLIVIS
jgi:hypothetical protein